MDEKSVNYDENSINLVDTDIAGWEEGVKKLNENRENDRPDFEVTWKTRFPVVLVSSLKQTVTVDFS